LVVVGRCGGPNILPDNPRFGAFISRFGRREFPVYSATGISLHGIDLSHSFHNERAGIPEKSTKFPVRRENPGILSRCRNGPWCSLPTVNADLRSSEPIASNPIH
jgi:hypothetical protein